MPREQIRSRPGLATNTLTSQTFDSNWLTSGASIADPSAVIGSMYVPASMQAYTAVNTPKITYSTGGTAGTKTYSAGNLMKAAQ